MTYTLKNIHTAPSYDALKRNGFTDIDVVAYYGTPIRDRATMFKQIKQANSISIAPTMPTPTMPMPIAVTQKCTETLFDKVDAKFKELMNSTFEFKGVKYNLLTLGYSFGWNNNKSRFGVHKMRYRESWVGKEYYNKRIELSRWMLDNADKDLNGWIDTILHEIAHGIDASIRGRSNHDWHWVMVAKAIGCSGERCGTYKVSAKSSKYTIKCPKCGHERPGHKFSKKIAMGHKSCGKCGNGVFDKERALIQIQNY